jgi:molybdopterin synthase catalytic subunit/molybdopterin synthase sulfur carrier subunit
VNVKVKLFAGAREAAGQDTIAVQLGDAPTVAELRSALGKQYPQLRDVVTHSMFAIDTEYSGDDRKIPIDATVVCIPPVSGG